MTTRELGRAIQGNKPSEKIEVHRIGRGVKRKQGGVKSGEIRMKNRKSRRDFKLRLRESVEI